jgi:hypothetical protein
MRQAPSATTFFGHEESTHSSIGTRTPSSSSKPFQESNHPHSKAEGFTYELDEEPDSELDEELASELEETPSLDESPNDELEDPGTAELEDSTTTELEDSTIAELDKPSTKELEEHTNTELDESSAIGCTTALAVLSSEQAVKANAEKAAKPQQKFFFILHLLLCIIYTKRVQTN